MFRLRLPRRFPPTREGWWFLVATLLVGAAAVNGGVNLLFLIFGMMLSLVIASGILSELCLRGLTVTRRPPTTLHAGTPFLMGIAVRNDKKKVPTFSLEVEDLVGGRPVDRRCYYLKLPAGRVQETAYRHVLPRRGYHQLTGFRLSTRFPFGLIRKSRDVPAPAQLLVYPALCAVPEHLLPGGRTEQGKRQVARPSRRGDFFGLREFRPGDDPRDVHWRVSARRGRLFIRESEEESSRTVLVVLEDAAGGAVPEAAYEAAVSLAASVALHLLKGGFLVGLAAGAASLPPAAGSAAAAPILQALATVQAGSARALPVTLTRGTSRVIVRPSASGPPALETVSPGADRTGAPPPTAGQSRGGA
jgi:uncharacterized protein (DUF58 family)